MAQQPISLENAMALAKQSADKGDVAAARNLYKKILDSAPGYKPARKALKKLPRGKTKALSTVSTFQQDMERMMALHSSRKLDDAMTTAIRMSKKYPDQPMPLAVQGSILFDRAQYAEAAAILGKAHEMAPDYDSTIHNLGQALTQLDRREEAMVMFNKALALNPNDATALSRKGNLLIESNETAEARVCLEKALEINPYDVSTQHNYGKLLSNTGSRKAALAHLRNALDIDPNRADVRVTLGNTLIDMKLYVAAIDELSKAAEIATATGSIHYRLGMAFLLKGDTEKAIASFERSIELDPEKSHHSLHFLAIAKGTTTDSAPQGYVREVFDDYASRFESSLVAGLGYDGPRTLRQLFDSVESTTNLKVADLGCGTGLAGAAFADIASELTGIDLSPKMLKSAGAKNLYSSLICDDVVSWMNHQQQTFDLFIAADMLIYVGALEPLFYSVRAHSHKNSRLLITTERLESAQDMKLLKSGRYAHSDAYVTRAAKECGFTIEASQNAPLRKEHGKWLEGGFYILKAAAQV